MKIGVGSFIVNCSGQVRVGLEVVLGKVHRKGCFGVEKTGLGTIGSIEGQAKVRSCIAQVRVVGSFIPVVRSFEEGNVVVGNVKVEVVEISFVLGITIVVEEVVGIGFEMEIRIIVVEVG